MSDAYTILGVARGATEDEIKRAYRKLAGQHHPDKGGDTAKFQEIQSAYETLSDPVKRQQHDNPNPFNDQFSNSGFEFHFDGAAGDIFQQFFRQGNPFHTQQRQQQRRNKDLRINLAIDLTSTLEEQTRTVSVQTTKGDRFTVDVTIPRGITHGTTIKYGQMGDNFFESLTRGDLYVIINILPHETFEVYGVNVISNVNINCIEAMLGTDKDVVGLDGKTFRVKIPQGCQHQTKFGLQGQGLYQMNTNNRGDLIVNVNVEIIVPSAEQAKQLRSIWNTL